MLHLMTPPPAIDIVDSSKLREFMTCPRKAFFREFVGLRPDIPNVHLEYGTALHNAMEFMLLSYKDHGYSPSVVKDAFDIFMEHYAKFFDEVTWPHNAPKDPASTLEVLNLYAQRYAKEDFEVLFTEVVGQVPVNDWLTLTVKIDAIARGPEGLFCIDHKTSGRDSLAWRSDFLLSPQLLGYTWALQLCFPEETIYGAKVFAYFLRKGGCDVARLEFPYTFKDLSRWVWNISYWANMRKTEVDYVLENSENLAERDVLDVFPMNTESCSKYGLCPFHTICSTEPNPLQLRGIPGGYCIDFWDPTSKEGKNVITDGKIVPIEETTKEASDADE